MFVTQLRGITRWETGEVARFTHPVSSNNIIKVLGSDFMKPKLARLRLEYSNYLWGQITLVTKLPDRIGTFLTALKVWRWQAVHKLLPGRLGVRAE